MSADDSISVWIGDLKLGEHDAARKLWDRYSRRLARLAETRLPIELRAFVGGDDVANRAFHEVVAGLLDGRFPKLTDRDDFWKLLAHVTVCRAINEVRNSLSSRRIPPHMKEEPVEWIVGRSPPPDLLAMAADDFEALLKRLDTYDEEVVGELRAIAIGLCEGYTTAELARQLGCTRARIIRKRSKIWNVLLPEV